MPPAGTLRAMNAQTQRRVEPGDASARSRTVTALWVLLLAEAALGLFVAIYLSGVAGDSYRSGTGGLAAEESTRFAAGGAILFAIAAFVAAVGARRRRPWSWTLGAVLQLILAISGGIALFASGAEGASPASLVAFALAAVTMLLLSASQVRRALGQA